jgi:ABC-type transporter Mla subunit MlaD
MYARRAELKAGIVVVLGIAALIGLLYVASGETIWGSWRYVHMRFAQGNLAPEEDDPVFLNGVQVGSVTDVRLQEEIRRGDALTALDREALGIGPSEDGALREIYVHAVARLEEGVELPEGTTAQINETITGNVKLALIPGRSLENLTDEQTRAKPIPARAAPSLTDIASRVEDVMKRVEEVVGGGTAVMDEARTLLTEIRAKVAMVDVADMNADVKEATEALRVLLKDLEARMARISANVEAASEDARRLAATGANALARVDDDLAELLATLKETAARVDRIVVRAEPRVERFLVSLDEAARSVRALAAEFQGVGPEVRALLKDLGGDADELMRNMIDTSRNLLDASEEVRARPWILVNEPEPGEIAYENLRIASQNHVRAARDLAAALKRVEDLRARAQEPDGAAELQRAIVELRASLEKFRAEQAFFYEQMQRQPR